jgi:hypothetical protein
MSAGAREEDKGVSGYALPLLPPSNCVSSAHPSGCQRESATVQRVCPSQPGRGELRISVPEEKMRYVLKGGGAQPARTQGPSGGGEYLGQLARRGGGEEYLGQRARRGGGDVGGIPWQKLGAVAGAGDVTVLAALRCIGPPLLPAGATVSVRRRARVILTALLPIQPADEPHPAAPQQSTSCIC